MIVKLSNEIFKDETQRDDLDYLLKTIIRRKHDITIDDLPDTSWMSQTTADVIEESYAASLIGSQPTQACEVVPDASDIHHEKTFSISEAIEYVSVPLKVVIENDNNDSHFIEAIIREYLPKGKKDFPDRFRLEFDNAGGCGNTQNHITGQLNRLNGRSKFLRHYVILDSDRRYPTEPVTKHDNLIAFLRAHSIQYHILHKRNMENYLPAESFPEKDRKGNKKWLDAFKSLTPAQRDHINIAGGFRSDLTKALQKTLKPDMSNLRTMLPDKQREFYATVSDANFKILSTGYPLYFFKTDFPKGYNDANTHRASLDAIQAHQSDPGELASIARDLQSLI